MKKAFFTILIIAATVTAEAQSWGLIHLTLKSGETMNVYLHNNTSLYNINENGNIKVSDTPDGKNTRKYRPAQVKEFLNVSWERCPASTRIYAGPYEQKERQYSTRFFDEIAQDANATLSAYRTVGMTASGNVRSIENITVYCLRLRGDSITYPLWNGALLTQPSTLDDKAPGFIGMLAQYFYKDADDKAHRNAMQDDPRLLLSLYGKYMGEKERMKQVYADSRQAAGIRDIYRSNKKHSIAVQAGFGSDHTLNAELSYRYRLLPWMAAGIGVGVLWQAEAPDAMPMNLSGKPAWIMHDDDGRISKLYLHPSVALISPVIAKLGVFRLTGQIEPGLLLTRKKESVGITYYTGDDGELVSESSGIQCSWTTGLRLNLSVSYLTFGLGYTLSGFDLYAQRRTMNVGTTSFSEFYPGKKNSHWMRLAVEYRF